MKDLKIRHQTTRQIKTIQVADDQELIVKDRYQRQIKVKVYDLQPAEDVLVLDDGDYLILS
jgi:hypothetical protein